MKPFYAIFLIVGIGMVGCARTGECISSNSLSQAEYVEQNHCIFSNKFPDAYSYYEGTRHRDSPGWTAYKCPDGTWVNIDNDQVQPKEAK